MSLRNVDEALRMICKEHPQFDKNAYLFLNAALEFTVRHYQRHEKEGAQRHVSGQELLEGIRLYALEQYGPLARIVLENWGVRRCEDFGEMVFILVKYGLLGKTPQDKIEDFAGGYDFYEAFEKPFEPKNPPLRRALARWD